MAQDDGGETQSDDDLVEGDPIPLHKRENRQSWFFHVQSLCDNAGIEIGDHVWIEVKDLDPDAGEHILTAVQLPDPGDDEIEQGNVRKIVDKGSSARLTIPHGKLEQIGLSLAAYDRDDPVMFRPIVDEGALFFAPLAPKSVLREQDDAETGGSGPPPGASSPVGEDLIRQVATTMSVDVEQLGEALEALGDVDVQEDIDLVADPVETTIDRRMRSVLFVETGTVTDLLTDNGFEDDIAEAARQTHNRLAEQLLLESKPERAAFATHGDAIVMAGPAS